MESKLDRARREIRQVDEEMLRLFERRMEAVRKVAAEKERLGLPVEDPAQEARVLAELAPKLEPGPLRAFYVQFQQDVMDVSKRWQEFLREQSDSAAAKADPDAGEGAAAKADPDAGEGAAAKAAGGATANPGCGEAPAKKADTE